MVLPTENNAGIDSTSLLCAEDACACLSDGDCEQEQEDASARCDNDDDEVSYGDGTSMFLQEEGTLWASKNAVHQLVEKERHYLPQADFWRKVQDGKEIDASSRRKTVSWLLKMRGFFKFMPYTASLSVNYLDRFLSLHHLPSGKAWTLQLLSVACLSLAVKMEEIEAPVLLDLQVGAELVFEPRTVQRMELLVLSTLGWRMSAVTPLSYTNHLINILDLAAANTKRILISRVNELNLASVQESMFLRYRPSSIAVAATLCALQELLPLQFAEHKRSLLCTMPQQLQGELTHCYALMLELFGTQCKAIKDGHPCESSVPQSPVAVLDASFSSNSISNATTILCHSSPPISSASPPKKRRLDDDPS